VRIAESLAKMRLASFATEADVDEALRLFQVSTLDAAMTGSLAGGLSLMYHSLTHSLTDSTIVRQLEHAYLCTVPLPSNRQHLC